MDKLGRFGIAVLLILLYMAVLCVPMYFVTWLDGDMIGFGILAVLMVSFATFPFVLDCITKAAFYFRGSGVPMALVDLRKQIMEVNFHDLPIVAKEKGEKISVTWKYLDAKWWEVLSKQGAQRSFELVIHLDEKNHLATLVDISRSIRWGAGPSSVRFGFSFFRGVSLSRSQGAAWGIKESFTLGKIYQFRFSSDEIHDPVMNTILQAGWNVRFGLL